MNELRLIINLAKLLGANNFRINDEYTFNNFEDFEILEENEVFNIECLDVDNNILGSFEIEIEDDTLAFHDYDVSDFCQKIMKVTYGVVR